MRSLVRLGLVYSAFCLPIFWGCAPESKNPFDPSNPNRVPLPPLELKARAQSSSSIRLTWKLPEASNAEQLVVERSMNSQSDFAALCTLNGGKESYDDDMLLSKTAYAYRVFGSHEVGGSSAYSRLASDTTFNAAPVFQIDSLQAERKYVAVHYKVWDLNDTTRITFYRDDNTTGMDGDSIGAAFREPGGSPGMPFAVNWKYAKEVNPGQSFYVYAVVDDGDTSVLAYSRVPFVIPPRPLLLRVFLPENGDTVFSSQQTLAGSIKSTNGLKRFLVTDERGNSRLVPVAQDSLWALDTMKLVLGTNRFFFLAVDSLREELRDTLAVVLRDTSRPEISILDRESHDVVTISTIDLRAGISDQYGIDSATAWVAGGDTVIGERGELSWQFSLTLKSGENAIWIRAMDKNGNRTEAVTYLTYREDLPDTAAPNVIILNEFETGKVTYDTLVVRVFADDDSGIHLVEVNGDTAAYAGEDVWHAAVVLTPGENRIRARAVDSSNQNNTRWDSLDVIYDNSIEDTIPPSIRILEPADGAEIDEPILQISGTVEDELGKVDSVWVICVGETLEVELNSNRWSAQAGLTGSGAIVVVAQDDNGGSSSKVIHFTYTPPEVDEVAPEIKIVSHKHGDTLVVNSTVVKVVIGEQSLPVVVQIGGEAVTSTTLTFERQVLLADGWNTIVIAASDSGENSADTSFALYYDKPPAEIRIDSVSQVSSRRLRASWTASGEGDVLGYVLQHSTDPSFTTGVTTDSLGSNTSGLQVNEVEVGTSYYFRLYTRDVQSVVGGTVAMGSTSLPTPPVLTVNVSDTLAAASLVWSRNSSPGFSHYRVFHSLQSAIDTSDGKGRTFESESDTTFFWPDLTQRAMHYFRVSVWDADTFVAGNVDSAYVSCRSYHCDRLVVRHVLTQNGQSSIQPSQVCVVANNRMVSLDLSGLGISQEIDTLSCLNRLDTLRLSRNPELTSLPAKIEGVRFLKHLDVSSCPKLRSIPEGIGELQQLTYLNLDTTFVGSANVPSSMWNLKNLVNLRMQNCSLSQIPGEISGMEKLNWLRLGGNQLAGLPEELGDLVNLTQLFVHANKITRLPASVTKLTKLQTLGIGYNPLEALPGQIEEFVHLEHIFSRNCSLDALPDSIVGLSNLKTLVLGGCKLSALPDSIVNLSKLENLVLGGCRLDSLPANMQKLQALTKLDLRDCVLDDLPSGIVGLSPITLDLAGNSLCPGSIPLPVRIWAGQDDDWTTTQIDGSCDD